MKKALIGITLLAGIGTIGYGIYKLLKEQVKLLESYCWKVKDVIIRKFDLDNVNLTIILLLKNQSDIDVELTDYNLDVLIDEKVVANVYNTTMKTNWSARSVSEILFDVNFNPRNFFTSLKQVTNLAYRVYSEPDNVIIGVKGTVTAKHSFIKIDDIAVDYSTTLKSIQEDSNDDSSYECKIEQNGTK